MKKQEKNRLRRRWQERRNQIPLLLRQEMSREICRNVLAYPALQAAETIFVYLAFRSEPETKELIQELFARKKRVTVPVCDKASHTMKAVEIKDFSCLAPGSYGILEPKTEQSDVLTIPKEEIDLVLVPGLAFDADGYRLGYGAGYYDRYLKGYLGYKMGMAFENCMVWRLPREEFDISVDCVVTNQAVVQTGRSGL